MTISLHPSTLPAVLSPVLTPFKADGSPDAAKLLKQCKWLEANGVGQAVFGTNSEANSMSAPQKMSTLTSLIEGGLNPEHMMPGTGATSIDATVNMTRHAVNHKCPGVLMLPPFYYKDICDDGLFAYFSEVIQKIGNAALQIYIYNIPPVTKINLSLSLLERLTKDTTEKSAVTPGPLAPAHELLGDMLLEAKQPAQALKEYELGLQKEPNRFRSVFGAAHAAELGGDKAKASTYYTQLLKICERGDASGRAELVQARKYVSPK